MKKKAFLIVCTAAMLAPTIAWAQYPQLTDEAKETYKKMITEARIIQKFGFGYRLKVFCSDVI